MKLFASSQDAIQDTTIELSEQELNAISGGCGPCAIADPIIAPPPPPPVFTVGFTGGYGFGGGFGFGQNVRWHRPCRPHFHHGCF